MRLVGKKRPVILLVILLIIILMSSCAAQRGRTDRYDGYTVRTEKPGAAAPKPAAETVRAMPEDGTGEDYVLNVSSMKFHYPECSGAAGINEQNRVDYHGTRESVLDMGYSPCKICNP